MAKQIIFNAIDPSIENIISEIERTSRSPMPITKQWITEAWQTMNNWPIGTLKTSAGFVVEWEWKDGYQHISIYFE